MENKSYEPKIYATKKQTKKTNIQTWWEEKRV